MTHVIMNSAGRCALSASVTKPRVAPRYAQRAVGVVPSGLMRDRAMSRPQDAVARRAVIARGKIAKITGEQLEVEIANRDTTLIVDFFATWCGPCLLLAKELEEVAEKMEGKVKIVKIDVDENQDLSSMLKIQGLPTIVIIPKDNGKPALRTEGLLPAAQIMQVVADLESGAAGGQPQPQPQPQQ